jgi:hypothetical protein
VSVRAFGRRFCGRALGGAPLSRWAGQGQGAAHPCARAGGALPGVVVPDCYDDVPALAAQLRWRSALGGRQAGVLADRLLARETLEDFLGCVRRAAFRLVGARHATTPEVIWLRGRGRRVLAPPVPTGAGGGPAAARRWRYLFGLGPGRVGVVKPGRWLGLLAWTSVGGGSLFFCSRGPRHLLGEQSGRGEAAKFRRAARPRQAKRRSPQRRVG